MGDAEGRGGSSGSAPASWPDFYQNSGFDLARLIQVSAHYKRMIAASLCLSLWAAGSAMGASPPVGLKKLPNIILIVLDSVRRDHLGNFGYGRATSPYLDRLAREGVVFTDVVAQSSQTAPAVASILTGLVPSRHGIQFFGRGQTFDPNRPQAAPYLDDRLHTLAEVLGARGYAAWGLTANPWLDPAHNFGQGFDWFELVPSWDGRHLNHYFSRLLSERGTSKPLFVYLHYMDAHAPYFHPDTSRGRFAGLKGLPVFGMGYMDVLTPGDLAYAGALYDEQIRNVDALIAALLTDLKAHGILQDTVIVVTADHGEEFGDHGGMGHGTSLQAEQVDSFLILWGGGGWKPRTVKARVRHVDLFPTLLELAGCRAEIGDIDGRSLWPLMRTGLGRFQSDPARPTASELGEEKAVFLGDWKYIRNIWTGEEKLYQTKRDPAEAKNLADASLPQLESLQDAWRTAFASESPAPSSPPSRKTLSEADIKRLESLGYLGGRSASKPGGSSIPSRAPFTSRIAFDPPSHNPLQLVFGWKGQAPPSGDRTRTGYLVGTHIRFLLKKSAPDARSIVIEGWWDGQESPQTESSPTAGQEQPGLSEHKRAEQHIRLELEGQALGQAVLRESGPFRLEFPLPPGVGLSRPLPFALYEDQPLILFEIRS